jgi:hypothetical protein
VPRDQLRDDILLDLLQRLLCEVDLEPRLRELSILGDLSLCRRRRGVRGDEHHLELAPVEVVTDDDLMAVPREGGARFRDEEVVVCFQLDAGDYARMSDVGLIRRNKSDRKNVDRP